MPIHLQPVSRRRFLFRSLLGGAGLALAPRLFADTRATDPDSYVFLSDIHLSADAAKVARNVNMTDHFKGVTREVLALPKKPAAVFITGDCAFNSGEKEDYAQLTTLLEPIREDGLPVWLAMGNHDNREHFWDALAAEKAVKRPVADRQVALVKTPQVNWIILDSLEKTLQTPGMLGAAQLEWLTATLDANPDKPAIILVHHNPGTSEKISGIKDTEALFEILRPRKQVKAYMYGHTHHWSVTKDPSGIHLINLPAVAYVFQEGQPSGWVQATVQPKGMTLNVSCLDKTHSAHGQVVKLDWRA